MGSIGRTDVVRALSAGFDRQRAAASVLPSESAADDVCVGVGLKPQHYRTILESRPTLGFFEIHAENYMGAGGPPHRYLEAIRASYDLSVHGVGLSIAGAAPLDTAHLARLKILLERYEPRWFSEHLAWSMQGGAYLNDLLPLPYTDAALEHVCARIDRIQDFLGRRLLLENPSTYVRFECSAIPEPDFIAAVASRTGCGLLLDVNNVAVSAANHDYDAAAYIERLPAASIGEIHLAGYHRTMDAHGHHLLIDAHGSRVAPDVWQLYRRAIAHSGPLPTLIEWDNDVPEWPVLMSEADQAARELHAARSIATRELADVVVG